MKTKTINRTLFSAPATIITAGSTYLDIDAYACCVAMAELRQLQGEKAIAYSCAPYNYSICGSLIEEGQLLRRLPFDCQADTAAYLIVDVSDPQYIKDAVPLEKVTAIYDHHVGFEEYWASRLGKRAHIEFIGAAATLVYREWKQAGLQEQMTRATALLLIAAILDNTLNLTSSNTTPADIEAFEELCKKESIGKEWCASYFSEVQTSVEADLKNALFHDMKITGGDHGMPSRIAQLCVWDAQGILQRLPEIRTWFADFDDWLLNVIDIHDHCSYFVCDDLPHQKSIEHLFRVSFAEGIARSPVPYLRKEIIKKYISTTQTGG